MAFKKGYATKVLIAAAVIVVVVLVLNACKEGFQNAPSGQGPQPPKLPLATKTALLGSLTKLRDGLNKVVQTKSGLYAVQKTFQADIASIQIPDMIKPPMDDIAKSITASLASNSGVTAIVGKVNGFMSLVNSM